MVSVYWPPENPKHYSVEAPHFSASISVDEDEVIREAAPILAWARGKHIGDFVRYSDGKGWTVTTLYNGRRKRSVSPNRGR